MSGDELQDIVKRAYETPADVVARVRGFTTGNRSGLVHDGDDATRTAVQQDGTSVDDDIAEPRSARFLRHLVICVAARRQHVPTLTLGNAYGWMTLLNDVRAEARDVTNAAAGNNAVQRGSCAHARSVAGRLVIGVGRLGHNS